MVFVIAVTDWDFGPMRAAEVRAKKYGKVVDDNAFVKKNEEFILPEGAHPTAWGLIIPLIVLIGTQELLENNGVKVITVDFSEILKGFGAVHCCSAFLKRG